MVNSMMLSLPLQLREGVGGIKLLQLHAAAPDSQSTTPAQPVLWLSRQ